jgi:hypothetical protein
MKLTLETTTGLLSPAGEAPSLGRGVETIDLRFLTAGVAGLIAGPIALKVSQPSDPTFVAPIATVNVWATLAGDVMYRATLDTLGVAALAWLQQGVLIGRVEYNNPTVNSAAFQINYGGGAGLPGTTTQIVITQPTGPVNYVQDIGTFGGQVALAQTEGFWRVKAAGSLLGLQLAVQVAPTGADLIVEIYKGGLATGKTAKITAGQKTEETIFPAALALQIGDNIAFRVTQLGSATKGANLNVKGIVQLQ